MSETEGILDNLRDLSSLLAGRGGREEGLREIAGTVAKLLDAENASVMLLNENERKQTWLRLIASYGDYPPAAYAEKISPGEGVAGHVIATGKPLLLANILTSDFADCARRPERPGRSAVLAPIRLNGDFIGVVSASGPRNRRPFEMRDLRLLEIVAPFIGKSHQVSQLQNLLKSRFIQQSLINGTEETISELLVSAGRHPDQMARTVAKSFYREMNKAGFSSGQIIDAASEIISELSHSLQRHRKRATKPGT